VGPRGRGRLARTRADHGFSYTVGARLAGPSTPAATPLTSPAAAGWDSNPPGLLQRAFS